MKILKQICIILLFYIIGEIISSFISLIFPNFFIPGTIIGMVILLILLVTKMIKLVHVEEVGTFLSNNMSFFFIPAAVSVIDYLDILQSVIFKVLIICAISIIVSFVLVAYAVKITITLQEKYKKGRN